MEREKKRKITRFDVLIVSALVVILISVGIRFYIAWNQDWAGILQSMTVVNWIAVVVILGMIVLIRRKLK